MSYNHNRSPRSTPRDPSTKKHVNQRLFLLAFVLPSTSPLIFLIISKIESILRPASTQIYNWNAFFTTAQWVVFFLVAYAIGIIAGIAGLIYLIGREKKEMACRIATYRPYRSHSLLHYCGCRESIR